MPYLAQSAELVRESRNGNSLLQSNRSSQTEQLWALPTADAEERAHSRETKKPKNRVVPRKPIFSPQSAPKKAIDSYFGVESSSDMATTLPGSRGDFSRAARPSAKGQRPQAHPQTQRRFARSPPPHVPDFSVFSAV
jgi:hypothetical protein